MSEIGNTAIAAVAGASPVVKEMRVVPVAGRDSMLLNLSGAHGPFFTRNIIVLKDSAGHTGVGEVPGGEKIRKTLEDARELVINQPIGMFNNILKRMRRQFADHDIGGRGSQTRDGKQPGRRRADCARDRAGCVRIDLCEHGS